MSGHKLSIDAMAHTVSVPTSSQVELLPRTGRTIANRYRITGLIGRGGMADVYQGDDMLLERPVAIKILHRHLASDSTGLERFRREGMTLASVTSANVVAIHDIGLDAGSAFMVMQYIAGHTLEQEIAQHGKMTPVRAGAILTQILDGLAALHARGLVHRDIKPSNVMLDGADRVVLLDLGIAFDSRRSRLTNPGLIAGTPGYMAPERQSLRTVDHKSDIYQVGLLLILLVNGVDPARSNAGGGIDELLQQMPSAYAQVARRALSAAPSRYATAAEMARAVATAREVCKTTAIDPEELRPLIVEAKVPRVIPRPASDTDVDQIVCPRSSVPTLELDTGLLRALATDQSLHDLSTSLKLRPKSSTSRQTQEMAPLRPRLRVEALQPFDDCARGSGPVARVDPARAETEKLEPAPPKRMFVLASIAAIVIALALAAGACFH